MKTWSVFLALLLGVLIQNKIEGQNEYSNFAPTVFPDRIMLSIPGDPATTRAVSWRTVFSDTVSAGEITVINPSPSLEGSSLTVTGTVSPWEEGSTTAMGHKVIFSNLEPNTKYAYRVGNGTQWSEWFQMETSSVQDEPFSFLYFGDVQNDIKSLGSRTLRQAYSHFPNADFMLFAGDLVSRSNEEYWREFFYAGGWMFGMMPSVPVPGNHEYTSSEDGSRIFSKEWNQIYTMPENGPSEKFKNRSYFIDYQGVRFVSLDSPSMGYNDEDGLLTLQWLDKTLEQNPNKWAIVFTHYPVYSCSQGRDSEKYRDAVKPILEKHGVDLVLQGHDHTYCRGQNLSEVADKTKNSPMYVVSVAGPKMYGLSTEFWSDRMASNTQLYQLISVSRNEIDYKSYTVSGDIYDAFKLVKRKSGINKVIEPEQLENIRQRTEIPESAKARYTEEDLKKYNSKFSED